MLTLFATQVFKDRYSVDVNYRNRRMMEIIKKIGWQFYLVNPVDHMYENVEEVPHYINEVSLVKIRILILHSDSYIVRVALIYSTFLFLR